MVESEGEDMRWMGVVVWNFGVAITLDQDIDQATASGTEATTLQQAPRNHPCLTIQ